ncbi:hypothetical protein [Stenotrophomonas sepilia]
MNWPRTVPASPGWNLQNFAYLTCQASGKAKPLRLMDCNALPVEFHAWWGAVKYERCLQWSREVSWATRAEGMDSPFGISRASAR